MRATVKIYCLGTIQNLDNFAASAIDRPYGLDHNFGNGKCDIYLFKVKQHDWLTKQGIIHEAWSPLASGPKEMMSDQFLQEIGQKYGKTAVQIALKVLVQEKVWTIPRSVNPEHIKDNIDLFDFELTDDEMAALRKLDKKQWCGWPKEMSEDLNY